MNDIFIGCIALAAMVAVAIWARKSLKPDDHIKIAAEQLEQARVKALMHRAAYEEHKALAECYEVRVQRLDPQTAIPVDTAFVPLGSK